MDSMNDSKYFKEYITEMLVNEYLAIRQVSCYLGGFVNVSRGNSMNDYNLCRYHPEKNGRTAALKMSRTAFPEIPGRKTPSLAQNDREISNFFILKFVFSFFHQKLVENLSKTL